MDNKELEEEARIHANLKKDFDLEDELYYNSTGMNAYYSFQEGAKSKWVEIGKINAKIEAVDHFCKLNGFGGTERHKAVVEMYRKQIKDIEESWNSEKK